MKDENTPTISILCPTFNHQRFIKFFIQSCIHQTFSDFELIIVDDCSTDGNVEEILQFQDPRIQVIRHEFNRGINATLNTAFEKARGKYIVFMAGDDMFKPNALEVLYKTHQSNPQALAIYPRISRIDVSGNEKEEVVAWATDKSREEILHKIFMHTNCLTSPGMSMSKENFAKILYPLDNAMCLHQDVQMHIKILSAGEILVMTESLICYRFDVNASNISFPNAISIIRTRLEVSSLMDTFLEIKDLDLLERIFAKEIKDIALKPSKEMIPFFLGRMAFFSSDWERQCWGYKQIMKSYDTPQKAEVLWRTYHFAFKDYLKLTLLCVHNDNDRVRVKYLKYKKLFNMSLGICVVLLILVIALWILSQ